MARVRCKRLLLGMLGFLAVAVVAAPAPAHPGGRQLDRLQAELGLSEDQVRAIHQAREPGGETRRQSARSLGEARRALRDLVLTGANEAAIQAKTAEVQQLLGQAVALRVQALQQLSQILTPEQREKLRALRPGHRGATPRSGMHRPAGGSEPVTGQAAYSRLAV